MIVQSIYEFTISNCKAISFYGLLISIVYYLFEERYSAFGLNNLGKIVVVPDKSYRDDQIPYCSSDCSQRKFSEGKLLSEMNKKKYGDIYLQRSGTYKEVVLTTPSQLQQYYTKDAKYHRKLDSFGAGAFLVSLLGECLGFQNGSEWSAMRKVFDPYFSHKVAADNLPSMIDYISTWISNLPNTDEFTIDPFSIVADVPFTCIAKYLYDAEVVTPEFILDLKLLIDDHSELMHYAFLTVLGRFKIFQYLPSKKFVN